MASAMFGLDRVGAFEVGAGAGHFQDAVVGAGAEAPAGSWRVLAAFAIDRGRAGGTDVAGGHLGVFFAGRGEAFELLLAGANDAVANLGRGFGIGAPAPLIAGHTPVYLPTLARRRIETLDRRLFGSLAETRTHMGSSEWLVPSRWLASCTICV
jgi:hypothetical protein